MSDDTAGAGTPLDTMSDDDLIASLGLADDADDAGSPESPPDEGTAPDLEEDLEADEADTESDGQPRDEHGRFVPRKPEADAKGTQAPHTAPVAEPAASDTPAPRTDDVGPPAEYVVDGRPVPIEGSEVGEDGVFLPADTWRNNVQPLLSAGHYYHHNWRALHQQQSRAVADAKANADAQTETVNALFELIEGLVQDPEKFDAWRENAVQNWEVWKARAEAAQLKRQAEARTRMETEAEAARRQQEQGPQDERHIQNIVAHVTGQGQEFAGVDTQRAFRQLNRLRDRVLVWAREDDPQGRWRKGDRLVDWQLVADILRDEKDLVQRASAAAAQAVETSRRKVGERVKRHPPTVRGGEPPSPGAGIPKAKTREEADRLLERTLRGVSG